MMKTALQRQTINNEGTSYLEMVIDKKNNTERLLILNVGYMMLDGRRVNSYSL